MTPLVPDAEPERRNPHWSYFDLALFLGLVVPALSLAYVLLQGTMLLLPAQAGVKSSKVLAFQGVAVLFLLAALYFVVSGRYGEPFWRSLGWNSPIPYATLLVAAGPLMAIAISVLGVALKMGDQPSEIDDLVTGRVAFLVLAFYGIVIAPIFEETIFRGFLLPLFSRDTGPWGGIVLTALPFGLLHGAQNYWAWQSVVLIGLVGVILGWVRYRTASTASSFVLHSAYNATQFVALGVMHWATLK